MNADELNVVKEILQEAGVKAKPLILDDSSGCESYDSQDGNEHWLTNGFRSYINFKRGLSATLINERFAWLFDSVYDEVEANAGRKIHDQMVAGLKEWMNHLKTLGIPSEFTLAIPKTISDLEKAGSMPAAHFALAILREQFTKIELTSMMGSLGDSELEPYANLLDTILLACSTEGLQATSDNCGHDQLPDKVRWISVLRDTGSFKFLVVVP